MTGISRTITALVILAGLGALASGCGDDTVGPPDNGNNLPRRWYVSNTAQGTGTGESWENAFTHPQPAVEAARAGDAIWVANGIYASRAPDDPGIPVLALGKGINVYGGFDSRDTSFTDRDPVAKPAVLDGNDAAYHVVVGATDALLDGFIVTGGYANGIEPHNTGGGIYNRNCAAEIVNCTFSGNRAVNNGGAIYNDDSGGSGVHPVISACSFRNNLNSRFGGAVFNHYCPAEITGCDFSGNYANHNGGGIYNDNSEAVIAHCIFDGNLSVNGGAVYVLATATGRSPVIENCLFTANDAFSSAGAVYTLNAAPAITNCTFSGNSAQYGGAISIWNGATAITNCVAWNDSAIYYDDEILVGGAILPVIRYSDIDQNGFGVDPAGTADADGNIRMNPLFAPGPLGPFYLSNTATGQLETSPCIDAGSGTAAAHGLGERTTRTDGQPDGGTVDIGYHYRIF